MSRPLENLSHKRFGKLIVIERASSDKCGRSRWMCQCDCGKILTVSNRHLKDGSTKSCGCLRGGVIKHGHTSSNTVSSTYISWTGIRKRCNDPNHENYKHYGSRGIKVYRRWLKFENFLEDMGEAPKGYQIDRIDNNKGYYKENCRWITPKQNNRNRRNNHLITYDGKTQCIAAWAEEIGINENTIRTRIRFNWSSEKTLTTPAREKKG